jgi:hypothetical protein
VAELSEAEKASAAGSLANFRQSLAAARCAETAAVSGSPEGGELWCSLPRGHDGQHWDAQDGITWSEGRPDDGV